MINQTRRRASFAAGMLTVLTSLSAHAVPILEFAPSDSVVVVGDSFSVDVFASDFTDLFTFQALLFYDPTFLSPNAITEGSFLSGAGTTAFFGDFSAGNIVFINLLLDSAVGVSGSGQLATLNFTALAPGTSSLTFADFLLLNSAGELIDAEARNGTVIASIPEPNSLALVAIGLLAGCFVLRSKLWLPRA